MVEITQTDSHQPVVILLTGLTRRQLHTDVVLGETMHRTTTRGFLEQHLSLLADIPLIEGLRLLVRKVKQTLAALFRRRLIDHVGDVQRGDVVGGILVVIRNVAPTDEEPSKA